MVCLFRLNEVGWCKWLNWTCVCALGEKLYQAYQAPRLEDLCMISPENGHKTAYRNEVLTFYGQFFMESIQNNFTFIRLIHN